MSFFERYALCCKEKGISPVGQAAADCLQCTKANISAFAKNGTTPKGEVVANAARMLDVSADYLLGLIDDPHSIAVTQSCSAKEQSLLESIRSMNDEGQEAVMSMVKGLLGNPIYKKCSCDSQLQKKA